MCYRRYGILGEQYIIQKTTREIERLHPYSFRKNANKDEIKDLIEAGIIEKVEDK